LFKAAGGSFAEINSTTNPTAKTAVLTIASVAAGNAGTYKCEVTDAASTKITSVESVLTVA
jgi:hypothetical protein